MLGFGERPPENSTPEHIKNWTLKQQPLIQARLDAAARSPVLRHLQTLHVLATETWSMNWGYGIEGDNDRPGDRCRRWLATLQREGVKDVQNAAEIAWVAYTAGRYQESADWLALAEQDTAASLWLRSRLERRDGRLAEATRTMAKVVQLAAEGAAPDAPRQSAFVEADTGYARKQSAAGDLAGLHLARGQFMEALDTFLTGDLWKDAAFLGDRILTVDELKEYVDRMGAGEHTPATPLRTQAEPTAPHESDNSTKIRGLRCMLARRLVRDGRHAEARTYFPIREQGVLDGYVAALQKGADPTLPKPQRAHALFQAAWIARHEGMELMGTEMEPDGFVSGGSFSAGDIDTERTQETRVSAVYDEKSGRSVEERKPVRLFIAATAEEKRRIAASSPQPARRFHYRWTAAALAWEAAGLMANGSEELADVLNTGGGWIKNADHTGADKFIQALERRCTRTAIGRAVLKKHWFVDLRGPWSAPLAEAAERQ